MKPFFIGNIEIKTPIIQGGMGVGISLSGLASAVANEGGIGVISCAGLGLLYPKRQRRLYRKVHLRTQRGNQKSPPKTKRNHRSEYHGGPFQLCRDGTHCHKRKNRRSLCRCRTSARPPPIPDTGKQNEVGAHCIFFKSGQDYM